MAAQCWKYISILERNDLLLREHMRVHTDTPESAYGSYSYFGCLRQRNKYWFFFSINFKKQYLHEFY